MSIIFKYKKIDRPEPVGRVYTPSIPVTLINKGKFVDIVALLDSGADVSLIPHGVAEILEIDLNGVRSEVIGVGGKIEAINATINVQVSGTHEKYTIPLSVRIMKEDEIDKFPILLGRQDFFENFDITFKEKNRKIVLKKT